MARGMSLTRPRVPHMTLDPPRGHLRPEGRQRKGEDMGEGTGGVTEAKRRSDGGRVVEGERGGWGRREE